MLETIDEARKLLLQVGKAYEQIWIQHQALFCVLHYQLGLSLEDIKRAETWAADNPKICDAAHEAFAPYYKQLEQAVVEAKVADLMAGPPPKTELN